MSFFRGPNGRVLVSADVASRFLRRFYAYIWGEGKKAFLDLPQGARIRSAAYHWYRPDSRPGTKNRPSIGAIETIAFWSGIPTAEWIGEKSSLPEKEWSKELPRLSSTEISQLSQASRRRRKEAEARAEERARLDRIAARISPAKERERRAEEERLSREYRPPTWIRYPEPPSAPRPYNFFEGC